MLWNLSTLFLISPTHSKLQNSECFIFTCHQIASEIGSGYHPPPLLENFYLLPQNQKESDQRNLGNLNYILYGYFDEKNKGWGSVSFQRWRVQEGCLPPPENILTRRFESLLTEYVRISISSS